MLCPACLWIRVGRIITALSRARSRQLTPLLQNERQIRTVQNRWAKNPTNYFGNRVNTPHRFSTPVNFSRKNRSFLRLQRVLCSAFFGQINLRKFIFWLKFNQTAQNLSSNHGFYCHLQHKSSNHWAQNIPYDLPLSGMSKETNNEKNWGYY